MGSSDFITFREGDFRYWYATEKEFSADAPRKNKRVLSPEQKALRKAAREARLRKQQDASRRGQARFESKEYHRNLSDLRIVTMRIEGKSCMPKLPGDEGYADELRAKIEKYENHNKA